MRWKEPLHRFRKCENCFFLLCKSREVFLRGLEQNLCFELSFCKNQRSGLVSVFEDINRFLKCIGINTTRNLYLEDIRSQSIETLAQIIDCASCCVGNATIQSEKEFATKYQSLMRDLRSFVDSYFDDINSLFKDRSHTYMVHSILSLLWNLADKTILVPFFVEADYIQSIVKWIPQLPSKDSQKRLDEQVIAILHNLCRHKKGLSALRSNDAFKILMQYKPPRQCDGNGLIDDLTQTYAMSLIALATNDNEQSENKDLICKASDKLYFLCKKAAKEPDLRGDGFHLSELLISLESALLNTTVVRHIFGDESNVEVESIRFFAQLLISFYGSLLNQDVDDDEKLIGKFSLKILLCISSYSQYRKELCDNDQFCVLIEGLSRRSKQDIAKRIRGNLKLDEKPKDELPLFRIEKKPMIYISYNWSDIKFCRLFVDKLSKITKIPIWVDYEHASWFDDMWDHIAPAIENATTIIVLLSSAYCDSKTNFQELSYAVALAKSKSCDKIDSIFFVETDDGIQNKREWITGLLNDVQGKNIVSFSEKEQHEKVCAAMEHDVTPTSKRASITNALTVQSQVCTVM